MNSPQKFRQHQQETQSTQSGAQQTTSEEITFESVEALLQFDREQNPIPSSIADRVNESIAAEEKPSQSWWQKLFGKT